MTLPLPGDMAYALFMGAEPFPLLMFLNDWRDGRIVADAGYVLATIRAYDGMVARFGDVRNKGKIRRG